MSESIHIQCDNELCKDGKFFKKCANGHDICSLCWIQKGKKYYCPICLKDAEMK